MNHVLVSGTTASVSAEDLRELIERCVEDELRLSWPRRVLLVPPDLSRRRSRAGEITAVLYRCLTDAGCDTKVLPAIGTDHALTGDEISGFFQGVVPPARVLAHRWRRTSSISARSPRTR